MYRQQIASRYALAVHHDIHAKFGLDETAGRICCVLRDDAQEKSTASPPAAMMSGMAEFVSVGEVAGDGTGVEDQLICSFAVCAGLDMTGM
jgi:hypothetical protein